VWLSEYQKEYVPEVLAKFPFILTKVETGKNCMLLNNVGAGEGNNTASDH